MAAGTPCIARVACPVPSEADPRPMSDDQMEGAMKAAARLCLVCALAACGGSVSGKMASDAATGGMFELKRRAQ